MPDSPTLPTHHDHTHSTPHTQTNTRDPLKGAVDESDVILRVGGTQSGWQTFKRFLKAAGLAIAGVALFHAMMAAWVFLAGTASHETFPVQSFQPFALPLPEFMKVADLKHSPDYRAPDQVFPLDLTRQNYISVLGGETRVVFTQLPHYAASTGAIILESVRFKDRSKVLVSLGDKQSHLDIYGSSDASHTIRIVIPRNVQTLPYMSLTACNLTLEIDESALEIEFSHLDITTDHLVALPEVLPEFDFLDIDTAVGNITGTFNISHHLSLHVGRGNIDAELNIVAPERYDSKAADSPPHVEATTDMGSIDLTVLSQAEDLESNIVAVTQMGTVRIQQTPHFLGAFEADVGTGEMKISTKSPKVLHFLKDTPGHAEGVVAYENSEVESDSLTGAGTETKLPSPVHSPPHCAPDALDDDTLSHLSIRTASSHTEPSFTTNSLADVPHDTTLTVTNMISAQDSEMGMDNDQERDHEEPSWPDRCESPFCFLASPQTTGESEGEPEVADLGKALPRGGLVRGEARMGSVELNL